MFLKKKIKETLKLIIRNPGINVSELVKQSTSIRDPKTILDALASEKIIFSIQKANQRQLYPNITEENTALFETVEYEELLKTKKNYPFIEKILERNELFNKLLGKNLNSILLFGSITREAMTQKSDIDILFIIEEKKMVPEKKMAKIFQNIIQEIKKEINPVWIETKEYKAQLSNPNSFAKQIQQNRTILYGTKKFLKTGQIFNTKQT